MQNVSVWLTEYMLARNGIKAEHAKGMARQLTLSESAKAELVKVGRPDLVKTVEAMKYLGAHARRLTGDQFKETMTVAHFDAYFADAISRAFYADYKYKVGQWQNYVYMDSSPDFRDVKRFRMTEPGTLHKRREKGEPKPTYIADSGIEYGPDEYARQFDVSWKTILNDDLGKIRQTPTRMLNAASRWIDQFVNNLYDNATTRGTLIALGAPWSGTGRLTAANLAIGLNAMMQRVDANGNQMNITNVNLVIPPILRIQAADILQDLLSYGGPGGNVLEQFVTNVYVDPYITTAGANVPWYLFADPMEIPAVSLVRLEGWPGPVVAMKRSNIEMVTGVAPAAFLMGDFHTGDVEFMVEDVAGGWDDASYVGVTDFRGIYYSNGTTP